MNVFIRADSSIRIGSGHVMRCLTLADGLRKNHAKVTFICRDLKGNLIDLIKKLGFKVVSLKPEAPYPKIPEVTQHSYWLETNWEEDARQSIHSLKKEASNIDWLIIDHYSLERRWEQTIRPHVKKIMVIDDLADRSHDCEIILDQNLYEDMDNRYQGLLPHKCHKLFGPKFALLRSEFLNARKSLRKRDGTVKRILIFFGGSDPTNETFKALEAVKLLNRSDITIDVVVGNSNPRKNEIEQYCLNMTNAIYHCQVNNMARLMAQADLAIGAGGTATWERCCLGLPSLLISLAYNQISICKNVHKHKIGIYLGDSNQVSVEKIYSQIKNLIINSEKLLSLSENSIRHIDCFGVNRVIEKMLFIGKGL